MKGRRAALLSVSLTGSQAFHYGLPPPRLPKLPRHTTQRRRPPDSRSAVYKEESLSEAILSDAIQPLPLDSLDQLERDATIVLKELRPWRYDPSVPGK
jgi:hypothetical protein